MKSCVSLLLTSLCFTAWGQSPAINATPSREFGRYTFVLNEGYVSPNLMEGRELNSPFAVAVDTSSNPPILYVADSANNRVLAWQNPASLSAGNKADKVIGQRDFSSPYRGGPGQNAPALSSAGLSFPNGLAVDSNGNLYVLDAGNNRILRFPKPLQSQDDYPQPDLVIGQKDLSHNQANEGSAPSAKTLAFNPDGNVRRGTLAFDSSGNLWVTDTLNHRVLRFPKSSLNASEPSADLVLGQRVFTSNDFVNDPRVTTGLSLPVALAIDSSGGVYVSDAPGNYPRVVYWAAPSSGADASRVLGLPPTTGTVPPPPNNYTLGQTSNGQGNTPQCVFTIGMTPFVCDSPANRIVRFNSPDAWPAITSTALSPPSVAVIGQDSLFTGDVNRGNGARRPNSSSLSLPASVVVINGDLWVADAGNNRIVSLPSNGSLTFGPGSRVLGQFGFDTNGTNLVEGRDLNLNVTLDGPSTLGTAIAVDLKSTPNHLYIVDTQNNRVLGFNDVRKVGVDVRTLLTKDADLVIGQADKFHTLINYPGDDPLATTDQGLFQPSGVAVDADGNVWIADSGNSRVLRFPAPFAQPGGLVPRANLVLGQASFTSLKGTDASSTRMNTPVGVAVFNNGDLAVSDRVHNRVLLFHKNGSDFANGQAARAVLGQSNFNTTTPSASSAGLNSPRGLAVDSSDRLYVADSSNFRVIVYSSTGSTPSGASGTAIPNVNFPEGVAVASSGEIWITAFYSNAIYRFREFSQLGANPSPTAQLNSVLPMAVALDQFDNVIAAEGVNRMTFFYAQASYRNAASYAGSNNVIATLVPSGHMLVGRVGKDFVVGNADASIPYPPVFQDYQVTINGLVAPITKTVNGLIFFIVPNNAPTSGTAEMLITKPATGEIVASGIFNMGPASPGFYTNNNLGTGQIFACNEGDDCTTRNGPSHPITGGKILIVALSGIGHLDGAPADGTPTGASLVNTPTKPAIFLGAYRVPDEDVLFSGLSPSYPGLWQINFRTPINGKPLAPAPGDKVPIIVQYQDAPSNLIPDPNTNYATDIRIPINDSRITTIALKY